MLLDAFSDLNWLAVLVAAVAYFAVGALWYGALFGKQWMAASGITPQPGQAPVALYAVTFVFQFVASLALALVARAAGASTLADGIVLGLVAGVGFALTALAVTQAFESRPMALQTINGGYHVVGMLVAGVIVTVWS